MNRDTLKVILLVLTVFHILARIFFIINGSNLYLLHLGAILINLFAISGLSEE